MFAISQHPDNFGSLSLFIVLIRFGFSDSCSFSASARPDFSQLTKNWFSGWPGSDQNVSVGGQELFPADDAEIDNAPVKTCIKPVN